MNGSPLKELSAKTINLTQREGPAGIYQAGCLTSELTTMHAQ